MDKKILAENYNLYSNKENFLIKCNQEHLDRVGLFCSEQCRIRQHIPMLYQQNLDIYSAELNTIQNRWVNLDKEIIDDQMAEYEIKFKEQLIGRSTTEEVHLALGSLEKKSIEFFDVIYRLIASMAEHKDLDDAVRMHLPKGANEFFNVFEQAKCLMQEYLFRSLCVTDIDHVMAKGKLFKLKFRLLINKAVEARICPFVVKSEGSSILKIPGAVEQHVYDHGLITTDFENFYLKPSAESYDLRMPGVTEIRDAQKPGGKRPRKIKVNSISIGPLERNVRKFVWSNEVLEADFSEIRLNAVSRDEQDLRKRIAWGNDSSPQPKPRASARDVGVIEKIKQTILSNKSGKREKKKVTAAASVEPEFEEKEKEKQVNSVTELHNYIVVTVAIQFPGVSFNFYRKVKVPVAVVSNGNTQIREGYGSAIWNLIVWIEEANKGNYQWDWPVPYGGAEQREVSDADYSIDHQHFVETYLNGLITILARVEELAEPQKQMVEHDTDTNEYEGSPISVETFLNDEDFSVGSDDITSTDSNSCTEPKLSLSNASAESSFSDKNNSSITDLIYQELNHILTTSLAGTNPRSPRNLNVFQLHYLSTKLCNFNSSEVVVTRFSFLKRIVKDTKMSFFHWFYFTCQAIGKNFGIEPKISNWFGDKDKSVWHSNFVMGYINESRADEILKKEGKREGENQLLLIRFSGSERQSVVIHMISGLSGPAQGPPVEVGSSESLATILQNPLYTPNYKIVTWNRQGKFVLKPLSAWHGWVDRAISSRPSSQASMASNASGGCDSPTPSNNDYPRSPQAYCQIKAESTLHNLRAELQIKPNAAKDLGELLTYVMQSSVESDYIDGPATKNKLREILTDNKELLRLLT